MLPGSLRLPIYSFQFVRINGNSIHCRYICLLWRTRFPRAVDRRKTLNLHKELETPINTKKRRAKRTTAKSAGAIGFKDTGGAIGFNGAGCKPGGVLAFNEQQLMNELTGLKKGGALGTIAATVIPALIQMAPQIISSIKDLIKGKQGGAL